MPVAVLKRLVDAGEAAHHARRAAEDAQALDRAPFGGHPLEGGDDGRDDCPTLGLSLAQGQGQAQHFFDPFGLPGRRGRVGAGPQPPGDVERIAERGRCLLYTSRCV